MTEQVVIKFKPQKKDLFSASYLSIRSRKILFWSTVVFFIITPWVLALGYLFFIRPIDLYAIVLMTVIPFIVVLGFSLIPLSIARNSPSLKGEHTYTLSDTGLDLSGPGFKNNVEWSLVTKYVKDSRAYMLMSGKLPMLTIPIRVLTISDIQTIEQLLKQKVIN